MNIFHSADSYSDEELKFAWMEIGLSEDPELEKQLPNYDFHFVRYNDTECLCTNCVPRKSCLYSDNDMFTYFYSPRIPGTTYRPPLPLTTTIITVMSAIFTFSSLDHKCIIILRALSSLVFEWDKMNVNKQMDRWSDKLIVNRQIDE